MTKYTNMQMDMMRDALGKHLERRDIIGYAAARNTRVLADELATYEAMKDDAIRRNGEQELDADGNPTGNVLVRQGTDGFQKFVEEMRPLMEAEHEPDVFKVKYEQAIGVLSGAEMLELEWMLED